MRIRKIISVMAISAFIALALFSSAIAAVYIKTAPPARKIVVRPVQPYKNAVWVSGHWGVKKSNYVWVSGHWHKNKPGYIWVDGHWKKTPHGWTWIKGHWRKR